MQPDPWRPGDTIPGAIIENALSCTVVAGLPSCSITKTTMSRGNTTRIIGHVSLVG